MSQTKSNPKYEAIIAKGKSLFWKHGIKRVTVEEICLESQVSKMTFYKFFPNKIELAKVLLQQILEESSQQFNKILSDNIPFTEKINRIIRLKFEATENISTEFISDLYKNKEYGLSDYMEAQRNKTLNLFIEFLTQSQEKGDIRKDIKIEFIMDYINYGNSLFENKALASKYDNPQALIMEFMNFLFYGLSPKVNNR
jgi:AcrR family transcriptional regulator